MDAKQRDFFQLTILIACVEVWKTVCTMVINQAIINCDMIIKHVLADLRRRRSLGRNQTAWHVLSVIGLNAALQWTMHFPPCT